MVDLVLIGLQVRGCEIGSHWVDLEVSSQFGSVPG